jgi:hypothetical protein
MKAISLLLLIGAATQATAQSAAGTELVPRELVDGLLSRGSMAKPVIYVGEIPREMVGKIYVPKNARILGGMSTNSNGTAVILVPGPRESVAADLEKELPKLGWKQQDPSQRMMNPYSEFHDAPIPAGAMRINPVGAQTFCGPSGGMTITLDPSGFADTRMTITASDVSPCFSAANTATLPAALREQFAGRPTLFNPVGARNDFGGVCTRGNMDVVGMGFPGNNMLASTLPPQALLDHYSKQLTDSGWTVIPTEKVSRTWQRNDSTGKPMRYTITIESAPTTQGCRILNSAFNRSR